MLSKYFIAPRKKAIQYLTWYVPTFNHKNRWGWKTVNLNSNSKAIRKLRLFDWHTYHTISRLLFRVFWSHCRPTSIHVWNDAFKILDERNGSIGKSHKISSGTVTTQRLRFPLYHPTRHLQDWISSLWYWHGRPGLWLWSKNHKQW